MIIKTHIIYQIPKGYNPPIIDLQYPASSISIIILYFTVATCVYTMLTVLGIS